MPFKNPETRKAWRRQRYAKHRAMGLCTDCLRKAFPHSSRCLTCLYAHSLAEARYRRLHREHYQRAARADRELRQREGRCIRCGAPLIEDETRYCMACVSMHLEPRFEGTIAVPDFRATEDSERVQR